MFCSTNCKSIDWENNCRANQYSITKCEDNVEHESNIWYWLRGTNKCAVRSGNFYVCASKLSVIAITHCALGLLGLRGRRLRGCSQLELALRDSPSTSDYTVRKSHRGGVSTANPVCLLRERTARFHCVQNLGHLVVVLSQKGTSVVFKRRHSHISDKADQCLRSFSVCWLISNGDFKQRFDTAEGGSGTAWVTTIGYCSWKLVRAYGRSIINMLRFMVSNCQGRLARRLKKYTGGQVTAIHYRPPLIFSVLNCRGCHLRSIVH